MFLGNHIIVGLKMSRKENTDNYLVIIVMNGVIVNVIRLLETFKVYNIHFSIKKSERLIRNVVKLNVLRAAS